MVGGCGGQGRVLKLDQQLPQPAMRGAAPTAAQSHWSSTDGSRRSAAYSSLPEPLRQLIDEPLSHPKRPSELSVLKQTVAGLYHDTRAWVAEEDEMRQLVAWLHDKVGLLQRAFHSLSDVLVEEVDSLRSRAESQAVAVDEALRQAREVARLKQELAVLTQARAEHTAMVSELARHRAGEASEVRRMRDEVSAVREEISEVRASSEREARAERAARVKLQEYVAGLESRLAKQDAIVTAHSQELRLARAVLAGVDAEARFRPPGDAPPAGPEGRHVTGDERKRQQWREQVLTLGEQPDVQVGRRHAAAAASSRWAGVAHQPTYLRATKPAYGAPQAACTLGL